MILGILSDTHDQLARTKRAVDQLLASGVAALIHCGDFLSPDIVSACAVKPFYFVFGNNDSDTVPELIAAAQETGSTCLHWGGLIELAGKRIGITHGHMRTDRVRLLAESPNFYFSGHSHIREDRLDGKVRRINPGALHRADEFTVAALDLETNELKFLSVPR